MKHKPTPLFPGGIAIRSMERGEFELSLVPEHESITGINWQVLPAWRVQPLSVDVECRLDIRAYPASGPLRDRSMLHMNLMSQFILPTLEYQLYTEKIVIHPFLWALFAETTLSTARGIIAARCAGTIIEKFPIPYRDGNAANPTTPQD